MLERRKFLTGLISLIAAPAIVRAGSLMPVKAPPLDDWRYLVRYVTIDVTEVYGRSPAMDHLPSAQMLDRLTQGLIERRAATESISERVAFESPNLLARVLLGD